MVNFEEKCTIAQFGSSEFGKIIMNHQKLHFVASTKSHDFVKLTAITNKAKMNLQNVLNQNQKKAIFSFSIQSNSKVYPVHQLQTCSLVQTQVFFYQKHD